MRTLHIVSHTHWDREWYRTFQQFRLKLVLLIDGLLDLLEKDPQFRYFMLDGQTIVLDDYLHMRPEKEALLRQYIQSGRILIGPWHILPDMFLVGPEAHVRNLLQGERTCQRFGAKMEVGYIPDPFGHPAQTPQILRGFGVDSACVWRGLDEEPAEFWWQAPDGSRVLMAYLRDSYSNGASLPVSDLPAFAETLAKLDDSLAAHSAAQDSLILLGTDHMQPPPGTAAAIAYADQALPERRVIHSTLPGYLAAVRSSVALPALPVVRGELRACKRMQLLPGVLSTRMWIKQRNRACENLLTRWVEPFALFAGMLGISAPELYLQHSPEIIRQAWRLLMENHPHDSICGCSIDQVHDEMKPRFDQVEQIGEELVRQSLERLAGAVQTQPAFPGGLAAVVVFNPLAFERREAVELELVLPPGATGFEIVDAAGQALPYETLGLGAQELVNARMSPAELKSAFGMINEGRVMGMGLQSFIVRREGAQAVLEVTFSQAEPDKAAWQRGVSQVQALLTDASLVAFQVRARTADVIRVRVCAPVAPGLGWSTFYVRARDSQAAPVSLPWLARRLMPLAGRLANSSFGKALVSRLSRSPTDKPPYRIQNEFFSVEVEPDGTLAITDRRSGRVYRGLNRFVDGGDCGDTYNYSPPVNDRLATARLKRAAVERHAVRQALVIELSLQLPAGLSADRQSRLDETLDMPIRCTVTLTPGMPRVEIHTRVENRAGDHRLRVHFPTPFQAEQALYDGHFTFDRRRLGVPEFDRRTWVEDPRPEVPQRAFTQVGAPGGSFTLANRGLPEIEVLPAAQGAELALTLLRCVGWLSRDDYLTRRGNAGTTSATPGAQMMGSWDFDYAVILQPGQAEQPSFEQAYAFETPLRAVCTSLHAGSLPEQGAFVRVEARLAGETGKPAAFIVSALKAAEDGRGWLLRGYNPGDQAISVMLAPAMGCTAAERVNLAEDHLADLMWEAGTGSVRLEVKPGEIASVLFRGDCAA